MLLSTSAKDQSVIAACPVNIYIYIYIYIYTHTHIHTHKSHSKNVKPHKKKEKKKKKKKKRTTAELFCCSNKLTLLMQLGKFQFVFLLL